MAEKYFFATGGRKTSLAEVKLYPEGEGKIIVNGKDYKEYFPYFEFQQIITQPFNLVKEKKFDVFVEVKGGGKRGQAESIRLAISKALVNFNLEYRPLLKKAGFLKRDARIKERKKYGLKKARRAPQWQKR